MSFQISYGTDEAKSKNKAPGRWVQSGESINVAGYQITKGFYYFGGRLKSLDGYGTDSSLVDNSLPTSASSITFEDESLGYWPKYIGLSPEGRGAYLTWLASDRNNPDTPWGYVFIYFYGIERRALVDAQRGEVTDSEYRELFDEVRRLRTVYGKSRSFSGYSLRLLEMMSLQRPTVVSLQDNELEPRHDSILFRHQLATNVAAGNPVSDDLALAWVKAYPEHTLRTPARRCTDEFSVLFKRRYAQKFGTGLVVKPNKTKLVLGYYPASSSLRNIEIKQENLPDPSVLKAPVKKLIVIAEACTDELDAYSRYLGKKGTSRDDINAVLLLPDDLLSSDSNPAIASFIQWANEQVSATTQGLVNVADFWAHTGMKLPERINKKEVELITTLASKAGFGIAPDSRFHHAKPSHDGKLVLFSEGHGQYFEPSRAFNETGMTLRLGAMVAAIDGNVDTSEVEVLHRLINHDTKLSPVEKRSLHAYLLWRLNTPANMAGIKTRLDKLGDHEKSAVSHILIGTALADGMVDPSEIKQLEKLYTALGLNKAKVASDIHNLSSKKVSAHTSSKVTTPTTTAEISFTLDEEILALHESETSEIQSMLSAIFVDDDPAPEPTSVETPASAVTDNGLDTPHQALFDQLTKKEQWARDEVLKACEILELMLDGAIETINDWAYELVDAPVLEDDEAIYVDQEIVDELKSTVG